MILDEKTETIAAVLEKMAQDLLAMPSYKEINYSISFEHPDLTVEAFVWTDDGAEELSSFRIIDELMHFSGCYGDDPFDEISVGDIGNERLLISFKARVLSAMLIRTHKEWEETYANMTIEQAESSALPKAKTKP